MSPINPFVVDLIDNKNDLHKNAEPIIFNLIHAFNKFIIPHIYYLVNKHMVNDFNFQQMFFLEVLKECFLKEWVTI